MVNVYTQLRSYSYSCRQLDMLTRNTSSCFNKEHCKRQMCPAHIFSLHW